jgi:hypothetical protein
MTSVARSRFQLKDSCRQGRHVPENCAWALCFHVLKWLALVGPVESCQIVASIEGRIPSRLVLWRCHSPGAEVSARHGTRHGFRDVRRMAHNPGMKEVPSSSASAEYVPTEAGHGKGCGTGQGVSTGGPSPAEPRQIGSSLAYLTPNLARTPSPITRRDPHHSSRLPAPGSRLPAPAQSTAAGAVHVASPRGVEHGWRELRGLGPPQAARRNLS